MPDRSAGDPAPPACGASRWATTTIDPGVVPASVPVTFWIVRAPSVVRAVKTLRLTWNPSRLSAFATSSATPLSPSDPGRRSG